ncbi:MAG: RIP metalloprotease RseP [Pseudomonadota bacterium]
MIELIGSIWWLAVALGLLVTFHEYGHYWVARRMGVRVLRFSVGFGKPLWSRRAASGTEFVVAAIPLGGYIKMLDERETPVAPAQLSESFNQKTVGQRSAIAAAGPAFNFIFAVAAFWLMFLIGVPESRPVIGPTEGIAAEAGLQSEDMIVRVDNQAVQTWTHTLLALIPPALDREPITVEAEDINGVRRSMTLALDQLGNDFKEDETLEYIGLTPWRPDLPAVIGEISPDSPAARADLRSGDRLLAIGNEAIDGWRKLVEQIPMQAESNPDLRLTIERNGRVFETQLTAEIVDDRPVIGIVPQRADDALQAKIDRRFTILRHGPIEALGAGFAETWRLTSGTLSILARMVTGQASLENLSGPITIARMANTSAQLGISRFLFFLGLISLSLAIINLLPIPILDGGQLLYNLIEWIKGSPLSERGQIIGQTIGLMMIAGLMSIAIFNDILRLFD